MKAKYKLIKQSDGKIIKAHSIEVVANFLGASPYVIKLHLNKEVQLNGYQIKSI